MAQFSVGVNTIGLYDPTASPKSLASTAKGYSIAAANRAAEVLALQHHGHRALGGRPALVAAETNAKRRAAELERDAGKHTMQCLLVHYCDHIESLGRSSHKDARSVFKLHVVQAWPEVAKLPANQVSPEQVADMMRHVMEQGKGRTANKLRSYVRAAYQTARAARSKASIPVHFKAYNVATNPAADTEPDETQNRADKNALSLTELRTYWASIESLPGFRGAVLRLHLLTGGQRIEQLVNVLTCNVSSASITLMDGKGRPGKGPRQHKVPLIAPAAATLLDCKSQGTYALSTDGGDTHLAASTLSGWAAEAGAGIEGFQAKRIRSGVETALASVKVHKDERGRLQSHGVAGVQDRHYDDHDYSEVKLAALETLFSLLQGSQLTTVANIGGARRVARS